jgi:hypothetical protein
MKTMIRFRVLVLTLLALALCSFIAGAQDMAVLASFKGTVIVTRESGQTLRVTGKEKLFPGDQVRTNSDGAALIMYYTGKEVYLVANQNHLLAKAVREDGFFSRLGKVFSSILWSKEPSKSVLGATREFKEGKSIRGISPSFVVTKDSDLKFKWVDTKSEPGSNYVVSVKNSDGTVVKSAAVKNADEVVMPLSGLKLKENRQLQWHVLAMKTGQTSEETTFSVLSDSDMKLLQTDLSKVAELCKADPSVSRRALLEAMLYIDRNLFISAEASLQKVVEAKPDLAVGHELLANVYTKIGRTEQAEAEKKLAQKLSVPQ